MKHNNKEYKLTDLNTGFTLRQQKVARKFLINILMSLQNNDAIFELQKKLEKIDKKDKTEVSKIDSEYIRIMLESISNIDFELNILALLYVPKGEKFSEEIYKQNLIDFEDLVWNEELEAVVNDFFTSKLPSLMKSSLTSLKAIRGINQIV